uniref:uncharacterized protein LOC109974472 n=1 Tax=Monopterus albus TaxID=43700 RepID=UPI0009B44E8E|nr:uncharacterized protein LOC109974472 [Monopterus albus]
MVTEDGQDAQRAETVGLKRKLTGPRRLLLGKTRTRSVGEDRPETIKDKMGNSDGDDSSAAAAETGATELDEEVLLEVNRERRCEDTGDDDAVRNRKVNRHRWWRRFTSVPVCIRRQKKKMEERSEKQQNQEADAALLNTTEENSEQVSQEKKRFNMRMMLKRFVTSSEVRTHELTRESDEKDGDKSSLTFQNKLRRFFTRGGRSRLSGVPLENMEEVMKMEEAPCPSDAQVDKCSNRDGADLSSEVVTVMAEMNVQRTEDRVVAEDPEPSPPKEELEGDDTEEGLMNSTDRSQLIHTDSEVIRVTLDSDKPPVRGLVEDVSLEKDEVFVVVLDIDGHLSASTVSPEEACEAHHEEKMDQTNSQPFQPLTNGPSIRIELVPPDDISLEDEEEECWEGGSSSENQNHLLLLLGTDHSERSRQSQPETNSGAQRSS